MNNKDIEEIKARLKGKSNYYYTRYINILREEKCLGLQYKLDNGLFTKENLKVFEDASQSFGQHLACIEALKLIEEYQIEE